MTKMYKWLNAEKARYYIITVEKEKTSQLVLSYKWGSCFSNRGGNKKIIAENAEKAQNFIEKMMKRRKSRGYQLISPKY